MPDATGFLYSQIGYDLQATKRALVRGGAGFLSDAAELAVLDASDHQERLVTPLAYWGEAWGSHWWRADFSALAEGGEYVLEFRDGRVLHRSEPVPVGSNVLWDRTIDAVAFYQLAERAALARNGLGFKDCGHHWRESSSHTPLVIGLCDLLEVGFQHLSASRVEELKANLVRGCDYLGRCQDAASELGLGDGALVHEFPSVLHVIPGTVGQAAVAFSRAGRLLLETHRAKGLEYLDRGKRALRYLMEASVPFRDGFHAAGHGADEGFVPPGEWQTRELVMLCWAAVELWLAGSKPHQRIAADFARSIMARQVTAEDAEGAGLPGLPEGGLWGHFRTYGGAEFTEKANTHHHWGADTGAVFPHYLYPIGLMARLWGYHEDAPRWKACLENFRDGYLIPACRANPFGILPMGFWKGEGLLAFSGPWHGCNVTLGFASALASELKFFVGGEELEEIATANLQWIAGLNAGVTEDSFASCLKYKETIGAGVALPVSMVHGVGLRSAECWTGIRGTVMNGFSNNPQFQHSVRPCRELDGPRHFTDEDWIPHAGGLIAALAWQREVRFFAGAGAQS